MDTVEKIYALTFRHRETGQIIEGRIAEVNGIIGWRSTQLYIRNTNLLSVKEFITYMDQDGFTLTHKADLIAIWKRYREEQKHADRTNAWDDKG